MITIRTPNVHCALPIALDLLYAEGIQRSSRNGLVLQHPTPVSTVYAHPTQRVLFWPERDANPFLHLYESLWMLAGRNDVAPLKRYTEQFAQYTDDGATLHGAYGYRWRRHFSMVSREIEGDYDTVDQLRVIAEQLRRDPTDRRCVLAMWDAAVDLGRQGKDLPCNDTATFQIGPDGRLDMVVFCRSNDIVWGAYGANAVHFSFLLEYMALWIGVPVGTYTQVSVNWHGYLSTLDKVRSLRDAPTENPYTERVRVVPFSAPDIPTLDRQITAILAEADAGFPRDYLGEDPWSRLTVDLLFAHHLWKTYGKHRASLWVSEHLDPEVDWVVAASEWLTRRKS